ncbi:hypothetical protein [Thiohalomonas denitrificans]|uniref:Uncharacterized protein n=1 Tax=Thiohalomonas denitrificans TaxID=415747 RepID=A0A1G5QHP7_9GAMM|nr:hypothetical protein [Thiohalomonas denitrificans]SCZ61324.1 hypothetical protein SAMN03097708_02118 [Thiohalomonas denitrificans]
MTTLRTMMGGALLGTFLIYPLAAPGVEGEPYDSGDELRGEIATDVVEGNIPVLGEGERELEITRDEAEPERRFVAGGEEESVPVQSEFSAFEIEEEGALPAHTEGLDLHQGEEVSIPTLDR